MIVWLSVIFQSVCGLISIDSSFLPLLPSSSFLFYFIHCFLILIFDHGNASISCCIKSECITPSVFFSVVLFSTPFSLLHFCHSCRRCYFISLLHSLLLSIYTTMGMPPSIAVLNPTAGPLLSFYLLL